MFGGLPGTGKSTIARTLALRLQAVHIRIDTIEQAMRNADPAPDIGPGGYMIAYAVARDNLNVGRIVIADSVNPISITREAWRDIAAETDVALLEVEICCSNRDEHRRRVENRVSDIPGLVLPTWSTVEGRHFEPWLALHPHIDTAARGPDNAVAQIAMRMMELTPPES